MVHGVTKSQTKLSNLHFHFHTHAHVAYDIIKQYTRQLCSQLQTTFCQVCQAQDFPFYFFLFRFNFFQQLIYNGVLVSGVQQNESVIHIHLLFLKILFPYRPLQSIEYSCLCCVAGSYQLSILYIVVCTCQSKSPSLSLPTYPMVAINLFSTSVTLILFCK